MLSFTHYKGACTGCSACVAACPVSCISMKSDEEGFWYPISTDACINCGKCEKVCPVKNHDKTAYHNVQHAYACLSKNYNVWHRSASGGAFSEICLAWGDDMTIIVGAAWDGLIVHHVAVTGVGNIAPLCKSKYVASYPENCFRDIRDYLKRGKKVIFCGTPCLVAGLKSFLAHDYESLLTIDLICHGVGSPLVFQSVVKMIENRFNMKGVHYEFRAKRKNFELDYLTSINGNGKTIYLTKDPYMQLFLKQLCLRPSCGKNCVFRDSHRQGDLTIADFKGLETVFPELKRTKRNYSTIVTNSQKGEDIVRILKNTADLRESSVENVRRFNPLFCRQTWFSQDRDKFFAEYIKDQESAIKTWTNEYSTYNKPLSSKILSLLPDFVGRLIKKYISYVF